MNHPNMKAPRQKKLQAKLPAGKAAKDQPSSPFDVWLDRSLHKMFDDVAQEPVPDELLKLIEGDRNDSKP